MYAMTDAPEPIELSKNETDDEHGEDELREPPSDIDWICTENIRGDDWTDLFGRS